MPDWLFEDSMPGLTAGIDEAGRGPWAGPVVAGAVVFFNRNINPYLLNFLNDSKKLSPQKREILYGLIQEEESKGNLTYGIGQASAEEIDAYNILQATFMAMRRAMHGLKCVPDSALIDGNRAPKDFICPIKTVVKGDALSYSIAAASIVAKVFRDKLMAELAQQYPGYAFERNAGYGTKDHIAGLKQFGVTPQHRKSYRPIAEAIQLQSKSD